MKALLIFTGLILMLSSCVSVYFTETQPKGAERLSEVPSELYGKWFGESEGWKIDENGLTNINIDTDSLGNTVYVESVKTYLSDSLRIYKAKKLYVIHSKEQSEHWEIIVMRPMKNGDINIYSTNDPKLFIKDKGLKLEEANYTVEGVKRKFKTLKTDTDDNTTLENVVISGQMKLKTLRKALTEETLVAIFKKDGTVQHKNI